MRVVILSFAAIAMLGEACHSAASDPIDATTNEIDAGADSTANESDAATGSTSSAPDASSLVQDAGVDASPKPIATATAAHHVKPLPDCDPPYVVDATGTKHFKMDCLEPEGDARSRDHMPVIGHH